MTAPNTATLHELVLSRTIPISRRAAFRAWTDPALLMRWFAPRPWTTIEADLDVRTGGSNRIVMQSPDGDAMPMQGVYLEVVPDRKIVTTDAYEQPWVPSAKPFFTMVLTLEDADGGGTLYTARALHWSEEDRKTHEAMGFHEGWGQCLDQLVEVMQAEDGGNTPGTNTAGA